MGADSILFLRPRCQRYCRKSTRGSPRTRITFVPRSPTLARCSGTQRKAISDHAQRAGSGRDASQHGLGGLCPGFSGTPPRCACRMTLVRQLHRPGGCSGGGGQSGDLPIAREECLPAHSRVIGVLTRGGAMANLGIRRSAPRGEGGSRAVTRSVETLGGSPAAGPALSPTHGSFRDGR